MTAGSVLAIHSTIGTNTCAEVAEAADGHGVSVIDAPVSGGGAAAAAGGLTVYVGGSVESVERARPVLETYGNPVLHMGVLGSGLRTKLVNNLLNAAQFGLAHDAMAVGEALGLEPDLLGRALTSGSGRSFSLEVFVGLGSLEAIAGRVGPLLSKDVGLFSLEPLPTQAAERGRVAGRGRSAAGPRRPSTKRGREIDPMTTQEATGRYSIDARTHRRGTDPVEPADFWEGVWAVALEERGEPAALDAEALGLEPVTIRTDGQDWSLRARAGRVEATRGAPEGLLVHLDVAAFNDLVQERKSAFGLAIAGRVTGDDRSVHMFCAWDPVLRSVLDGRSLYRPGDVDPQGMGRWQPRPRPGVRAGWARP